MSDKTPNTKAIEAEAAGDPTVTVTWPLPDRLVAKQKQDKVKDVLAELVVDVPRDRADWTLDAELASRYDDPIAFVHAMIPRERLDVLRVLGIKNREVAQLSEAIVAALGFSSTGESAASSD